MTVGYVMAILIMELEIFLSEANRASGRPKAGGRERGSRSDFTGNDKINLDTRTDNGQKKGPEGKEEGGWPTSQKGTIQNFLGFSIKLTDIQGVEEQRLFKLNLYPFIISAKSEHLQVHCEDRVSHDQWRGEGGLSS